MSHGNRTEDDLARRVTNCTDALIAFSETVYRLAQPKYANNRDLLSGKGAYKTGGRWNPIGLKAIYLSLTPATALAELRASAAHFGFGVDQLLPQTLCAIRVELEAVLDLGDGRIRQRTRFPAANMIDNTWRQAPPGSCPVPTQTFGLAAANLGVEGLIVPSAADRPAGRNLVIFPHKLRNNSRLDILNADRLIKPGSPPAE
jgi:RES domain-containing protein